MTISKPVEERSLKERIVGVGGDTLKQIKLAKGGQFSHVDYMVNPDGWTDLMVENQNDFQAIHRLMSSLPSSPGASPRTSSNTSMDTSQRSPRRFSGIIS